jgi:hypothetical protein
MFEIELGSICQGSKVSGVKARRETVEGIPLTMIPPWFSMAVK